VELFPLAYNTGWSDGDLVRWCDLVVPLKGEKTLTERWGKPLPAFPKVDVLPAEEAGIDGPGAGSDHRQSRTEDRQYDGNPRIAGVRGIPRVSDPRLNDGCQRSRHRGPQADQKKYPRNSSHDMQDGRRQRRCFKQVGDPKMEERSGREQPQ
jgi:hypothetical protein